MKEDDISVCPSKGEYVELDKELDQNEDQEDSPVVEVVVEELIWELWSKFEIL